MWYVITKLATNCKDGVQLIKMVKFKAVVLFIRILTCFISHRASGNVHSIFSVNQSPKTINPQKDKHIDVSYILIS